MRQPPLLGSLFDVAHPLLIATTWIDVAIPGVAGLIAVLWPRWFVKRTDSLERALANASKLRACGLVLMAVAAVYYVVMALST